jgi:hypothetical protein
MPHLQPVNCETPDLYFPMLADVYFPIISQGAYGEVKKQWVFDRTIAMNAMAYSRKGAGEITPQIFLQYKDMLISRTKKDIRITSNESSEALTNILITNIRSGSSGQLIYLESAGTRAGRGTIYEIAVYDPHFAPYGEIDYYSMTLRRSENQAVE